MELQGGTVTAASEGEGRGATFTVELPAQAIESAQADDAATVDDDPHLLRGLRVLVVDDDEDARELAVMMLSARGADVVVAGSAIEALERVKALRPDVLVCDIGMPEMDGYSLMREVRALSASDGGDTPAIAVTGFSRREDLTQAEAAGFAAHIAKPVDLSTMARAVAEVTKRRG